MDAQVDGKELNHALLAENGFGVRVKEEPGVITIEGNINGVSQYIEDWIKQNPHRKLGVAKASFFGKNQVSETIQYTQKNQNE